MAAARPARCAAGWGLPPSSVPIGKFRPDLGYWVKADGNVVVVPNAIVGFLPGRDHVQPPRKARHAPRIGPRR
jgi:hypothetical protein